MAAIPEVTQTLAAQSCVRCADDEAPISMDAVDRWLVQLPGWRIEAEPHPNVCKTFDVKAFSGAIAFAAAIGRIADDADHHPRLTLDWGRVEVRWWTHTIGGLHGNDFVMAARTEVEYAGA